MNSNLTKGLEKLNGLLASEDGEYEARERFGSVYAMSLARIIGMNGRFARLVEAHRLGRTEYPYFAKSAD